MNNSINQCVFFDNKSFWKLLPWQEIETRILLVQQKIYKATKEYNRNKLYKIQNYLLNSNEARLIAINRIVNSIANYYKKNNNEYYYFNDQDKFTIFQFIFSSFKQKTEISNRIKLVIEKTREYLIYLCIQPEWYAKYEPLLKQKICVCKNNEVFINNSIKFSKDFLISQLYIFNIIHKLRSLPYIKISIDYWIKNNYSILYEYLSFLHITLIKIYCIGLEWYELKSIKLCLNKKYHHNKSNCKKLLKINNVFFFLLSIYCEKNIIILKQVNHYQVLLKQLYIAIRNTMYSKDYLERNRLKTYLRLNNIINKLIYKLITIYLNYISIIDKNIISISFNLINRLISLFYYKMRISYFLPTYNKKIYLYKFFYQKNISLQLNSYLIKINR